MPWQQPEDPLWGLLGSPSGSFPRSSVRTGEQADPRSRLPYTCQSAENADGSDPPSIKLVFLAQ